MKNIYLLIMLIIHACLLSGCIAAVAGAGVAAGAYVEKHYSLTAKAKKKKPYQKTRSETEKS